MSDDEWSQRFQEYIYTQRVKNQAQEEMLERAFKKSLVEVVNGVFKALNKK